MILIWFCQAVEVSRIGLLFPFYSLCYICCPCAPLSKVTVERQLPLKHIVPSHKILCHRTRWWGNPSWSSSATRPPTSSSSSFSSLSHSGLRISLGIKIFMVNIIIIRYLGNHCVMRIIRVIEGVRVIMLLGNRHSQRRDYVFVGRRYMWPSGIEEELLLSDSDEKRDPRKNLNIILGK